MRKLLDSLELSEALGEVLMGFEIKPDEWHKISFMYKREPAPIMSAYIDALVVERMEG